MTKEQFWIWFDANKAAIEAFILSNAEDYTIYEKLTENIQKYSNFLIPELTQDEDNNFILIISCDGEEKGIPFAEELVKEIREFENWKIVKYRQPGPMRFIQYDGLLLKRKRIFLTWHKSPNQKYYITFYIRGYLSHDPRYRDAAILHLDHTVGEYYSMTKIEGVDFERLGLFQSRKQLNTLDDFKSELDH